MSSSSSADPPRIVRDGYCGHCGSAFSETVAWPRTCDRCGLTTYRNPTPVVVLLVPIAERGGLLIIRRAIEPARGQWALPGGYIDIADPSWQHAASREVREETGVRLPPESVTLFDVMSVPGRLLVMALTAEVSEAAIPAAGSGDGESDGWDILTRPTELAFPTHTAAAAAFFARRPR